MRATINATKFCTRGIIVIAALVSSAGVGLSQEKLSPEEKAKRMSAYYEAAKPGPEHKQLESLAGKWNLEIKYWPGPGSAPIAVTGKAENKMILGGRFLLSEAAGGEGPMGKESLTIIGFDRRHKKFTIVGYDSGGTYFVTAAGPYDAAKKAIIMYGEDVDPVLGHTQKYDMILRVIDSSKFVQEVVFKDPIHTQGKGDFKAVEITFTKAGY